MDLQRTEVFIAFKITGIMSEDLLKNISDKTLLPWLNGDSVADLLPAGHPRFYAQANDDGTRSIDKINFYLDTSLWLFSKLDETISHRSQ